MLPRICSVLICISSGVFSFVLGKQSRKFLVDPLGCSQFISTIFICKPIFKIFAAHFRIKGMLNHDKIIFV